MSVAAPTSRFVVGLNGHPRIATLFPAAAGAERDAKEAGLGGGARVVVVGLVGAVRCGADRPTQRRADGAPTQTDHGKAGVANFLARRQLFKVRDGGVGAPGRRAERRRQELHAADIVRSDAAVRAAGRSPCLRAPWRGSRPRASSFALVFDAHSDRS